CDSGGGGGGGGGGEDITGGEDAGAECDPACGDTFVCIEGTCVPVEPPACDPACGQGFTCVDGECVPEVAGCDPACGEGFTCVDGACVPVGCTPDCAGKECGDDGCGALCGTCDEGFFCEDGACIEGECTPDCAGKECGDNGCGALCGTCEGGLVCQDGQCEEEVCEPMCIGKECGPDGCGGECDVCDPGSHCEAGLCVDDPMGDCSPTGNVANLRACPEGPVDVTLTAVVTYVYDQGYFLQDASAAVQVYVGNTWTYDAPTLGDELTLHVTEYGNYQGQQQILASDAPVQAGNAAVEPMKLDVSAGIAPAEALESRVIKGTGFTVETLGGKDATLAYGGLTGVAFRVEQPGTLCAGATFDLATGLIAQYGEIHELKSYYAMDLVNIDLGGCAPVVVADMSNWGFEEPDPSDPPPDFEKLTLDFTAHSVTAAAKTGLRSCELTWTSQDNQDLAQGLYTPITAGQTATYGLQVKDGDPAGRVRLALRFFDADKVQLSNEFGNNYSSDGQDWASLTFSFAAPEGAAFVRAFVRMYDVSAGWDGNATLHVDDWTLTVQ
ncbi:MAG: hypothetical protein FJ098_13235, partial [Deltaproteobacteria bacterium]|nr:hypothetical protein [Deltaproteobacteria bacterium]